MLTYGFRTQIKKSRSNLSIKTRKLEATINGEHYKLTDQSAQDLGRYDYLVDIERIEQLIIYGQASCGYGIMLTNDSAYWKSPRDHHTIDSAFRIHNGRIITGNLEWKSLAAPGTIKGRESVIKLFGSYQMVWSNYSKPSTSNYGRFMYVVSEIEFRN
jgi:hypothetical protein